MPILFKQGHATKQFAIDLTDKLAKRYPVELDADPSKRASEKRLTRVLEETFQEASAYQKERKLGIIGKAKLSNEFKWALREKGYSAQFIEIATEGLVVYLTGAAKSVAGNEA